MSDMAPLLDASEGEVHLTADALDLGAAGGPWPLLDVLGARSDGDALIVDLELPLGTELALCREGPPIEELLD